MQNEIAEDYNVDCQQVQKENSEENIEKVETD